MHIFVCYKWKHRHTLNAVHSKPPSLLSPHPPFLSSLFQLLLSYPPPPSPIPHCCPLSLPPSIRTLCLQLPYPPPGNCQFPFCLISVRDGAVVETCIVVSALLHLLQLAAEFLILHHKLSHFWEVHSGEAREEGGEREGIGEAEERREEAGRIGGGRFERRRRGGKRGGRGGRRGRSSKMICL